MDIPRAPYPGREVVAFAKPAPSLRYVSQLEKMAETAQSVFDALLRIRFDLSNELIKQNARLDALSGSVQFIDPMAAICDETRCPIFTPQGELISYDGGHLTWAGSVCFGGTAMTNFGQLLCLDCAVGQVAPAEML